MNGKVNILMVDDQPAKLLSYEAILDELGENLIKANSGREAMEVLLKNDVAVVLMDVSMPELDGFELADIIRQHPRFEKTAILFISAVHLTDIDRLKGYQRGAVDYISVPVVPELLRAKVSVFAELHRKTRDLEMLNFELRCLSGRLIATQDDERRRLAREMHDGFGQDLVAAKMVLDRINLAEDCPEWSREASADASRLLDSAIQQVRSMSHLLHPPMLDEVGLKSALEWYLDGLAKRSGIDISIDITPANFPGSRPSWRPPSSASFKKPLPTCSGIRAPAPRGLRWPKPRASSSFPYATTERAFPRRLWSSAPIGSASESAG